MLLGIPVLRLGTFWRWRANDHTIDFVFEVWFEHVIYRMPVDISVLHSNIATAGRFNPFLHFIYTMSKCTESTMLWHLIEHINISYKYNLNSILWMYIGTCLAILHDWILTS